MKYLLDTNIWIDYLTGRYPTAVTRIQESPPDELCLSSIVLAELRYGAEKSRRIRFNHRLLNTLAQEVRCVDFDPNAATTYGEARTALEKRGETSRCLRHDDRRARIVAGSDSGHGHRAGVQAGQVAGCRALATEMIRFGRSSPSKAPVNRLGATRNPNRTSRPN